LIEQASGAGFSPDGTRIAYSKHLPGSKPLWAGPRADPGRYREISAVGFTPRWSPDGRWVAYTTSDPEGTVGDLWIASDDLATRRRLTTERLQFHGLAWTPDSRHVIHGAHGEGVFRVWKIAIDGGPAVAMTAGVGSSSSPAVAPDGRTLLFSRVQPSRNLVYAPDVEGSASTDITEGTYHVWPVLSPDGGRVASVIQTPGFDRRLFVTDVGTGAASRVSDQPARHPAWLDRGRVAYLGPESADGTDVRVVDLATGVNRTWCRLGGSASWLALSPDRRRVGAVLSAPNGRQSIVVRDLRDGREFVLSDGGEYEHLRWVPGRDAVSWSGPAKSAGPQTDGIWIGEIGGAAATRLVPDGYSPAWKEDGSGVYYSRIGTHAGLWRFDVGSLAPVQLRQWAEIDYFDVRGGRLVFARIGSATRIFRLPLM
jgi:TolB protein